MTTLWVGNSGKHISWRTFEQKALNFQCASLNRRSLAVMGKGKGPLTNWSLVKKPNQESKWGKADHVHKGRKKLNTRIYLRTGDFCLVKKSFLEKDSVGVNDIDWQERFRSDGPLFQPAEFMEFTATRWLTIGCSICKKDFRAGQVYHWLLVMRLPCSEAKAGGARARRKFCFHLPFVDPCPQRASAGHS